MAVNAYDVQVCLWKMIKISSKTCFNVSKKHPYISSCSLFMFLLYMCCPLFFWILIYTLPLAVSTWVFLTISSLRDGGRREKEKEERESSISGNVASKKTKLAPPDSDDHVEERRKKSFSRVRSVRRRRAKEIAREDEEAQQNAEAKVKEEEDVEEKNAVSESPKEIHEVEVETSGDHKIYQDPDLLRSLKLLKDEGDARDEANKVMEVGISEAERNKRLESLIARRRSRKMLSLQIKRSLMNTDASPAAAAVPPPAPAPAANISAIVVPKINTWCSPSSKPGGNFSPTPGSAPSVMIPMRNPFDLPYDPQEEKLDLTGDSFQQEFALGHNRDYTFCRHESFSLGPSLPMDFLDDCDDTSSIDDFGFRRRRSSFGYQFSRPETDQESETDFGPTTEPESESKSNIDSPDDDQIKEVIQVHEINDVDGEEVKTRPRRKCKAQDELSLNSNSNSSSPASSDVSEDERPVRIINREAILKSLSMRRNSVPDIDTNDNAQLQENNLSYANSALENASRLKQQYLADKPQKRHGMTFSIASDMQVEVSEISSPPLTIDENMSHQDDASGYDGEMERNASWDGLDSWAGLSRLSEFEDNEMRLLPRAHEAGAGPSGTKKRDESLNEKHFIHSSSSAAELSDNAESQSQTTNAEDDVKSSEEIAEIAAVVENAAESEGGASTSNHNQDANDLHQQRSLMQNAVVERVHHATISPKSVLQPTLSVASFEPDADDEVQLPRAHFADHSSSGAIQNSTPLVQFTVATSSNGHAQVSQIQENVGKAKEVAAQTRDESSSSRSLASNDTESVNQKLKIQENHEKLKEAAEGSSSRSFNNTDEISTKDLEAANPTTLSKNVDQIDSSISSESNEKEMVIQESTHNDSTQTSSCEGQNSVSQEDIRLEHEHEHEHNLNKPEDHERETKDEVVDSDAGKPKLVVEENDISESFKKNEAGEEAEQHANLHEAMPETINSEAK
ncbi:hypothetical protein C2S52_016652 [Perilla frutescens var. hirtella]|nr:hypothetical protein C2S52_016652 [Perilla frutescens var. hirtella]